MELLLQVHKLQKCVEKVLNDMRVQIMTTFYIWGKLFFSFLNRWCWRLFWRLLLSLQVRSITLLQVTGVKNLVYFRKIQNLKFKQTRTQKFNFQATEWRKCERQNKQWRMKTRCKMIRKIYCIWLHITNKINMLFLSVSLPFLSFLQRTKDSFI